MFDWCEQNLLTADIVMLNRMFTYYLDDKDGLNRHGIEYLDVIFAEGRRQAKQIIGELAENAAKDPQIAEVAQWYVLLAYLHLAKLERQVSLNAALEFIEVDQGSDEEIHQLVWEAKEDNVDAMYSLCCWYHEDERRGNNPYLSAVVYHLGQYLCQTYREHYFKTEEVETREALLEVWIDIALRMGEDGDLEPIHIGLYQGDPLCGSLLDEEVLVQRLGLSQDQVVAHLYNAWECGYDVDEVLYEARKKDKERYTEWYLLRYNRKLAETRSGVQEKMEKLDRIMTGASHSGGRR